MSRAKVQIVEKMKRPRCVVCGDDFECFYATSDGTYPSCRKHLSETMQRLQGKRYILKPTSAYVSEEERYGRLPVQVEHIVVVEIWQNSEARGYAECRDRIDRYMSVLYQRLYNEGLETQNSTIKEVMSDLATLHSGLETLLLNLKAELSAFYSFSGNFRLSPRARFLIDKEGALLGMVPCFLESTYTLSVNEETMECRLLLKEVHRDSDKYLEEVFQNCDLYVQLMEKHMPLFSRHRLHPASIDELENSRTAMRQWHRRIEGLDSLLPFCDLDTSEKLTMRFFCLSTMEKWNIPTSNDVFYTCQISMCMLNNGREEGLVESKQLWGDMSDTFPKVFRGGKAGVEQTLSDSFSYYRDMPNITPQGEVLVLKQNYRETDIIQFLFHFTSGNFQECKKLLAKNRSFFEKFSGPEAASNMEKLLEFNPSMKWQERSEKYGAAFVRAALKWMKPNRLTKAAADALNLHDKLSTREKGLYSNQLFDIRTMINRIPEKSELDTRIFYAFGMGFTYLTICEDEKAEDDLNNTVATLALEPSFALGESQFYLGLLYQFQSKFDNAERNFLDAREVWSETAPEAMIRASYALAGLYREMEKLDKAESCINEVLEHQKDNNYFKHMFLLEKGTILSAGAKYFEAEQVFQETIYLVRQSGKSEESVYIEGMSRCGLASCVSHELRFEEAKYNFKLAKSLLKPDREKAYLAVTLGSVLMNIEGESPEVAFQEAETLLQQFPCDRYERYLNLQRALYYSLEQNWSETIRYSKAALESLEATLPNHSDTVLAFSLIGCCSYVLRQKLEFDSCFQKVFSILGNLEDQCALHATSTRLKYTCEQFECTSTVKGVCRKVFSMMKEKNPLRSANLDIRCKEILIDLSDREH